MNAEAVPDGPAISPDRLAEIRADWENGRVYVEELADALDVERTTSTTAEAEHEETVRLLNDVHVARWEAEEREGKAEARLAAVLALCDQRYVGFSDDRIMFAAAVRAAADGTLGEGTDGERDYR